ncbi:LysR family transcriptional regulator [Paremcibacter congregatus]|uniref:Transcriptional regulator n=1 Tax=Paremcibacter congregatus TaxID=2043170 RepID=A0A2G4YSB6_9PROT|nr:LysR family transcriptional regulator [Paremcibacter congregatus]PHZ85157.1 transcriptional regulator [Paremcibacter congregatus]QDE27907.1 LysR family transcriptional regulator [Paremcibacter congregatus]
MRKPPLNLKVLESFCAIMRVGTVTEAAKSLHLTQSAVSRQLAQLEDALGMSLFLRDKGRLLPLPEAHELFKEADFTLSGFDRIRHLAEDLQSLSVAKLRIVGTQGFIDGILAGAVTSFMMTFPDVKIFLDSRSAETVIEQVAGRAVDCGFVKSPLTNPLLSIEPMFSCGTVCAVKREHPLARLDVITARDLHDMPLILLGKGRSFTFRGFLQQAFHQAGAYMNIKAETHTVSTSCTLAAGGIGIAPVNELMAQSYRHMGLAFIPFHPVITHEFSFITSAQFPPSRVTQAFLAHCKKYFNQIKKPSQG